MVYNSIMESKKRKVNYCETKVKKAENKIENKM